MQIMKKFFRPTNLRYSWGRLRFRPTEMCGKCFLFNVPSNQILIRIATIPIFSMESRLSNGKTAKKDESNTYMKNVKFIQSNHEKRV